MSMKLQKNAKCITRKLSTATTTWLRRHNKQNANYVCVCVSACDIFAQYDANQRTCEPIMQQ